LDLTKEKISLYFGNVNKTIKDETDSYITAISEKNACACQLDLYGLTSSLRFKGILQYICNEERHSIFELCYNSAEAFHRCNLMIDYGMPHDENMYGASNSRPLFDALFSIGAEGTMPMVELMATERRPQVDHPLDYKFILFLMFYIHKEVEVCEEILEEIDDLREEDIDVDIEKSICLALHRGDKNKFQTAMNDFLTRRMIQITEKDGIKLGDEYVSIEALALRRLALDHGMEVTLHHQLTPLDLQKDYPGRDTFTRLPLPAFDEAMCEKSFWDDWNEVESW